MKVVSFFHLLGNTYPLFIILPFHFTLFSPSLPFLFPSLFRLFFVISFLYASCFISLISITSQSPPPLIKLRLLSCLSLPPLSHSLLSTVYPAACPFPSSFPDKHNRSLIEGFFGSRAISHHRRGQSLLLAPTPVTIQGNSEMHGFPGHLLQKRVRNREHSVFHTDERSYFVLILTLASLKNNNLIFKKNML